MQIKVGNYQHFKGGKYKVIGVAKHSETLEDLVVYQRLADDSLWVRPAEMFLEDVAVNGVKVLRFKYLGK